MTKFENKNKNAFSENDVNPQYTTDEAFKFEYHKIKGRACSTKKLETSNEA